MTLRKQTNSFWSGGQDAQCARLDAEEAEELLSLNKQLSESNDKSVTSAIKEKIRAVKATYRKKRRDTDSMLYFGKQD